MNARNWAAAGRTWLWEARCHQKSAVRFLKAGNAVMARIFARAVLLYKSYAEACFSRSQHAYRTAHGHED